jgi:uncharacterized repeat protein (TIGR03803 family)
MRTLRTICGLLRFALRQITVFLLCATVAIPSPAQTFTSLVSFNGTNGIGPEYGPLVQGRDGNYYGTASGGGLNSAGTVFQGTPGGKLTPIYNFCSKMNCTDGSSPVAGLVLGTDGNFYGTTFAGGDKSCDYPAGCGTIFKITSAGVLTMIYTFTANGGAGDGPTAGLVQGSSGSFYGMTGSEGGDGTIFKITPTGTLTTLHFFGGTDGLYPYGGLALGTDGNFYGTTLSGGNSFMDCSSGCGTVFKMTPAGKLTTLHSFTLTDGANPVGGLVQAGNGRFYGTTATGGVNQPSDCGVGSVPGCGTAFEITPSGTLSTLYNFSCSPTNCTDGAAPYGTLVAATDGNLYGTTYLGGICCGALFAMTPNGAMTTLYDLCDQDGGCQANEFDGLSPFAGLLQATNGTFYGTTYYGGTSPNCSHGCGTIFSLSNFLAPFVEAVTYSGKVGATIEFLGQGFTKSTTVSFNGTLATPSVKSGTYLTAKIPSGATTGLVSITTSRGSLQSNKIFRVIPQIKSFTPTSGPAGTVVTIAGVSLTADSTVTFGGIQATSFTVNSYTQITATVPTGAKTGGILITTAGGTATSSGKFTVAP